MVVQVEVAKVYRGGGRRWFTLDAACNAEARRQINARCECVDEPEVGLATACPLHEEERYPVILRRLARMHKQAYLRSGGGKP